MLNKAKKTIDTSNAIAKNMENPPARYIPIVITWNGYRFDTYFWKVETGWFVCITNWEKCCFMSDPTDVLYNAKRLNNVLNNEYMAEAIAWGICNYWKGDSNKE